MSVVTEYPIWLAVFCLGLGFLFAFVLYRKPNQFKDAPLWLVRVMFASRFLTVSFLAFLLLSPLIKYVRQSIQKPIIVIAQDNSESVILNRDSMLYKNEFSKKIASLSAQLGDKYEVNAYTFGETLKKDNKLTFSEKQTDISQLFDEIRTRYVNRNVGAMVLASDGIYNKGVNPLYSIENFTFPIYTLALGDTSVQKDILLSQLKTNKIAFLGNKFPVQVVVEIKQMKNATAKMTVSHGGKDLFTKEIAATSNHYTETVNIELDAQQVGLQRYTILLTPQPEEISTKNNSKEFVIDVIDSKQKILILANSPHPDMAALKSALEMNLNFEVEATTIDKFTKDVLSYNLIILHQLPSKTNNITTLLSTISKKNIPVLFIFGGQSSFANINNLQFGLNVAQTSSNFDEAHASYNRNFSVFEVSNELQEYILNMPPLLSPFGTYSLKANSEVLFYQKIKGIVTNNPLVIFNTLPDTKVGFVTGEGLWRWNLQNYLANNNHNLFNELINKIANYLALKVNKERFVINSRRIYNENEAIQFDAEVYNESYELINNQDVTMEINNSANKRFNFTFAKTAKAYQLNVGSLPIGDYSFVAKTVVNGKNFIKDGKFTVVQVNVESENSVANHQLLYQIASRTKAKMYAVNQIDSIANAIKNNKEIVPISYSEKTLHDLVYLRWLFFVLLFFFSVEWFLRKYYGGY